MRKTILLVMISAILICLAGCGETTPAIASDGTPWSEDWTVIGPVGVEDPGSGFTIRDNKYARKMYYAAWSAGSVHPYVNADGEETDTYDAQIVLLLVDSGTADAAQASIDEWLAMAKGAYAVTSSSQQTCSGQEYTVLTYTFSSDTDPYSRGASAFSVYDDYAVSTEFACQEDFEGDALEVLTDFLANCHYAAE